MGAPLVEAGERRAVWMLAVGQTLGYACFYYIFAALVVAWESDLHWTKAALAAGPTLAIIVSAVFAPFVGRLVDRGWGRVFLTNGVVIGVVALAALAMATQHWVYLLAWAMIGVAQSLTLYEVCFALLIHRLGLRARAAITRVTLVAGFASTLAFPAGAVMTASMGWRGAVWVAAGVALFGVLPLNWLAMRNLGAVARTTQHVAGGHAGRALRRPRFWGLVALFSVLNLNHWMLVSFLLPMLAAQGVAQALAVTAAACIGPAQVLGRLALMRFEARIGTRVVCALTSAGILLAAMLLASTGLSPILAFGFAVLQGAAMGVMTILRPVLVAGMLGRDGYGAIAGMMSIPTLVASAAAPMLGAVLIGVGGAPLLMAVAVGLAGTALVLALAFRRVADDASMLVQAV